MSKTDGLMKQDGLRRNLGGVHSNFVASRSYESAVSLSQKLLKICTKLTRVISCELKAVCTRCTTFVTFVDVRYHHGER